MKYYDINPIIKKNCVYNLIIGERSNGKTYGALVNGIKEYLKTGGTIAIIRRWREDIIGRRASDIFSALNVDGTIKELSKGKFEGICYFAGKFYLYVLDDKGKIVYSDSDLIGYAFSLSDVEHNKSVSYPTITNIIFDEFLTNKTYLNNEFIHFMNTVSTIVRQRVNVKIYMLGNTVNKFSPYFTEMGITGVASMKQGSIDIYKYGDSSLKVAVEYCKSGESTKKNNFYFAFNNPKLDMITGGAWELDFFPHLEVKYKSKDILLKYFIEFQDNIFQCEIIQKDGNIFTYIHSKTTPLKENCDDIIFTFRDSIKMNYIKNMYQTSSKVHEKILYFFKVNKVFYQNNDIGNTISNYLKNCRKGV
ncbi:MAG: phage DNA encapsidation protein [Cetobacterium sp.]